MGNELQKESNNSLRGNNTLHYAVSHGGGFLMPWSFSLKERVDDQDQWASVRWARPGVPQFLCTSVDNIVLLCTCWATIQRLGVVLLKHLSSPSQKNFLVNRLVRGSSQCTEPAFSGVWRGIFTLLDFHECFLRSVIKKQMQGTPSKKDDTNQACRVKE